MSSLTSKEPGGSSDSGSDQTGLIIAVAIVAVVLVILMVVIIVRSRLHYKQILESKRQAELDNQPFSLKTLSRYFKLEEPASAHKTAPRPSTTSSMDTEMIRSQGSDQMAPNIMYGSPPPDNAVFPGRPSTTSTLSAGSTSTFQRYGRLTGSMTHSTAAEKEPSAAKADESYMNVEHQGVFDEEYEDMRPACDPGQDIPPGSQSVREQATSSTHDPQTSYVNINDTPKVDSTEKRSHAACSQVSADGATADFQTKRYIEFPVSSLKAQAPQATVEKMKTESSGSAAMNYANVRTTCDHDSQPISNEAGTDTGDPLEESQRSVISSQDDAENRYIPFPVQSVGGQSVTNDERTLSPRSQEGDQSRSPSQSNDSEARYVQLPSTPAAPAPVSEETGEQSPATPGTQGSTMCENYFV